MSPTHHAANRSTKSLRTAVLVIHGVGNQRPLQTLRAAADALYIEDDSFGPDRPVWLTFDRDNDERDVDLPVLTTGNIAQPGDAAHYVDFHECYWADLMSETRFVAVPLWLFELVRKGPGAMAQRIRPLWFIIVVLLDLWLLAASFPVVWAAARLIGEAPAAWFGAGCVWIVALAASFLAMRWNGMAGLVPIAGAATLLNLAIRHAHGQGHGLMVPMPLTSAIAMAFSLGMIGVFVVVNALVLQTVVGDAARYYRAAPANIGVRRAIRKLAVDRLTALHDDPRYDRIVVVAHSLGSTIGYDMLHAYWAEHCNRFGDPGRDADFAEQDKADGLADGFDAMAWRRRAGILLPRMQGFYSSKGKQRWIVSDFVTVGSSLTHAAYLSAEGTSRTTLEDSFVRQRQERELPQNPALRTGTDGAVMFHIPGQDRSILHAGAMFSVMRWTNLYFPLSRLIFGDVVGGEVTSAFGRGVRDLRVPFGAFCPLFAHTNYFNTKDRNAVHLRRLRAAVNLRRTPVGP